MIQALLVAGADPNEQDSTGKTIVHRACSNLKLLSECKMINALNKNAQDFGGSTPLHHCLRNNIDSAVQSLLTWGVDINIRDNSGNTPLMLAVELGLKKEMEILLSRGACTDRLRVEEVRALMGYAEILVLEGAPFMARSIQAAHMVDYSFRYGWCEVPSIGISK